MRRIPEYNFPAFLTAGDLLRGHGHIVYNPAEADMEQGFEWEGLTGHEDLTSLDFDLRSALRGCLSWITRHADAIVVLDGWEQSKGARAEVATAVAIGIPVHRLDHVLRWGIDHAVDITQPQPELEVDASNGDQR